MIKPGSKKQNTSELLLRYYKTQNSQHLYYVADDQPRFEKTKYFPNTSPLIIKPKISLPFFNKSTPLFFILRQINLGHNSPPNFLYIHFNIILQPRGCSSQWCLYPIFLHQSHVCTSPAPAHMCHKPCPSHSLSSE